MNTKPTYKELEKELEILKEKQAFEVENKQLIIAKEQELKAQNQEYLSLYEKYKTQNA